MRTRLDRQSRNASNPTGISRDMERRARWDGKDGWNEVKRDRKIDWICGWDEGQAMVSMRVSEQSLSLIFTRYPRPTAAVLVSVSCRRLCMSKSKGLDFKNATCLIRWLIEVIKDPSSYNLTASVERKLAFFFYLGSQVFIIIHLFKALCIYRLTEQ